jgi:hypothetical protein
MDGKFKKNAQTLQEPFSFLPRHKSQAAFANA